MCKVFSLLVVIAGFLSQANAALLVKYEFNNDSDMGASFDTNVSSAAVDTSLTIQNGRIETAGLNQTLANTTSVANFFLKANSSSVATISEISFDARILSGLDGRASLNVFGLIGSFDNDGVFVADDENDEIGFVTPDFILSTTNPTSFSIKAGDTGVSNLPIVVSSGKVFQLTVSLYRNGSSIASASRPVVAMDNVAFSGAAVPEPASMAVFALVGLPVLARRFARKV